MYETAVRLMALADDDQVKRIGAQLEQLLRSEVMTEASAACTVAGLVGWFYSGLPPTARPQFEQLIEDFFAMTVATESPAS